VRARRSPLETQVPSWSTEHGTGAGPVEPRLHRRGIDQRWVADISEFACLDGKLYLAGIKDLHDQGLAGWSMGERQTTDLVVDALVMAVARRVPDHDLVHHADRGSQYTALEFSNRLKAWQIHASYGSTGDCFDNAAMESTWAALKREIRHIYGDWEQMTRSQLRTILFEYIETPHQPFVSSGGGNRLRESDAGVVSLVGAQAVVELADELVEQVPECGDVVVTEVAASLIVGSSGGVVSDRGERPDVAGGGEAVILGSSCADPVRLARCSGHGRSTDVCLERSAVGEPVGVVPDLGKKTSSGQGTGTWERRDDRRLTVFDEHGLDPSGQFVDGVAYRVELADQAAELDAHGVGDSGGLV
jgi:transposase InsO family protein